MPAVEPEWIEVDGLRVLVRRKNVKNITQLPLTGAAGTALFTIVALVMAGAGLALVFRFREPDTTETV